MEQGHKLIYTYYPTLSDTQVLEKLKKLKGRVANLTATELKRRNARLYYSLGERGLRYQNVKRAWPSDEERLARIQEQLPLARRGEISKKLPNDYSTLSRHGKRSLMPVKRKATNEELLKEYSVRFGQKRPGKVQTEDSAFYAKLANRGLLPEVWRMLGLTPQRQGRKQG